MFLYLLIFGKHYTLNTDIPTHRNNFIHRGHIPTPTVVIEFAEKIYQEITKITSLLNAELPSELQQVVMESVQLRNEKIPKEVPRATTTGTMFFSLSDANRKETVQES